MPRRLKETPPSLFGASELPFESTTDEIKRAVERNAINRGALLLKIIVSLRIDDLLNKIKKIAQTYDKEDILENANEFNIGLPALEILDKTEPPIPYPYYFCSPNWLIENPELVFYYRNVAMLSTKVMNGIGFNPRPYEEEGQKPSPAIANEIAKYLNGIIGELVLIGGVSQNRHIEMLFGNLGDSLGGSARNEVSRVASAQVVHLITMHMHEQKRLKKIIYALKGDLLEEAEENQQTGIEVEREIAPENDLSNILQELEKQRVKYHALVFDNGYSLLIDRTIVWKKKDNQKIIEDSSLNQANKTNDNSDITEDENQSAFKMGIDFHSTDDNSHSMTWAAELKGGADPAGSDEHWKTTTEALNRIIEAHQKTVRAVPPLSFMATILVTRVAREAQGWIKAGKLRSVYNLTKIEENKADRSAFLSDIDEFLGYPRY